jgi:streptogramin lyase
MRVFVSYSSHDGDSVRTLAGDLERARLQVWYDLDLGGGESWWVSILEQIRECTVFVFALSDNSLRSKPCRAELEYARSLGVPMLPVQIGAVSTYRTDPIFATQLVDYRDPGRDSGIALVSALHESAARRSDLPDPLPDPPPIPYEYLLRLGADIRGEADLAPTAQAALVFELRTALADEDDTDVREDIRELLRTLRARRDVAYSIVREIDTVLTESDDETPTAATPRADQPVAGAPSGTRTPSGPPTKGPAPAAQPAKPGPSSTTARPRPGTAPRGDDAATPQSVARPSTRGAAASSRAWPRGRIIAIAAAAVVVAVVATLGVLMFARSSHRPLRPAPPPASGQIELPLAGRNLNRVAVSDAGDVYVTDDSTNQVLKLAAGTRDTTNLPVTGLLDPAGVAIHGDTIYLADRRNDRVLQVGPSGAPTTVMSVKFPAGVAVDSAGTLYVTTNAPPELPQLPAQVLKQPAGATAPTELPFTGLKNPASVAVGPDDAVYVSDLTTNQVVKLGPGSTTPTVLPFTGLQRPFGVAVDAAGNLYVSDQDNNRVLELAAGSTTPTALPFSGLRAPRGVAVGPAGAVFVVDAGVRVLKLPAV